MSFMNNFGILFLLSSLRGEGRREKTEQAVSANRFSSSSTRIDRSNSSRTRSTILTGRTHTHTQGGRAIVGIGE